MKLLFISRFSGIVLLFVLLSSALVAQEKGPAGTLPAVLITGSKVEVNEKVEKAFNAYFKDAQDLTWSKADNDFLARYMMGNQQQSALFNKRGNLVYHIVYGIENSLPEEIRRQVKSVYYDYSISRAYSIKDVEKTVWVLNLEDANNILEIRVEEGQVEKAKQYRKAS
jgi:hypothetical protein